MSQPGSGRTVTALRVVDVVMPTPGEPDDERRGDRNLPTLLTPIRLAAALQSGSRN
jgi:hypothetical protein